MKLEIKDTYKVGNKELSRNHIICIPPFSENTSRIDIIGEKTGYHYNCNKMILI